MVVATGCSRAADHGDGSSSESRVVVTLGSEGNEPNGLAVSGSDVYWASVAWDSDAGPSGWGTVQTVTTDGGAVTVLGAGLLPLSVVADDANVYWTTMESRDDAGVQIQGAQILRTPRAGGTTTVLLSGANITAALAIDAQNLYWGAGATAGATGGVVMAMPLAGGTPTTLATASTGQNVDAVAADGEAVYWATHMYSQANVPSGTLSKVTLATRVVSTLAATELPAAVTVGPSGVYWTDNGRVLTVGLDGGPVTTIATSDTGTTGPVAIDAASVYWSDAANIWKAPLGGGAPTVLAPLRQGYGAATGLAVDGTSVYWATTVACASSIGCAAVEKVTPK
jgi:hypothetical protein